MYMEQSKINHVTYSVSQTPTNPLSLTNTRESLKHTTDILHQNYI